MSEKLNAALIDMIHRHVPEDSNPATIVADTLNIGREAAYRRLRGEVLFSFSEAAMLGARLDFSLDKAMGLVGAGTVLFQLGFDDFYSTLEKYIDILQKDTHFFRTYAPGPGTVFATAGTAMPAEFYMRREHVAKFKFFRWLYQHGMCDPKVRTFEQMTVPDELTRCFPEYVHAVQEVATTYYVLDNHGFAHWVNGIRAFRAMHLISDQSIRILHRELLEILDQMEEITVNGQYANGNKVFCYLSDVDLEATYNYVSTTNHKISSIGIFSLNSLRSSDATMFDHVKRWIQAQARFSTLISGSGEVQRISYFKRQREALAVLEREGDMPSLEAAQNPG